jgi:hypothetical protein
MSFSQNLSIICKSCEHPLHVCEEHFKRQCVFTLMMKSSPKDFGLANSHQIVPFATVVGLEGLIIESAILPLFFKLNPGFGSLWIS